MLRRARGKQSAGRSALAATRSTAQFVRGFASFNSTARRMESLCVRPEHRPDAHSACQHRMRRLGLLLEMHPGTGHGSQLLAVAHAGVGQHRGNQVGVGRAVGERAFELLFMKSLVGLNDDGCGLKLLDRINRVVSAAYAKFEDGRKVAFVAVVGLVATPDPQPGEHLSWTVDRGPGQPLSAPEGATHTPAHRSTYAFPCYGGEIPVLYQE